MDHEQLVRTLQDIVGTESVIASADEKLLYEYDASFDTHVPDVVVLPQTTEQVSKIVRLAAEQKIPLVARGAGTGLSGGALPLQGGIVLVLARMRAIHSIDTANRRAVVEAGVVNQQLVAAANAAGFTYAPDPGSGRTSTIGGNIASNAGGPHCLAHGVTLNHVAGLTVVLADGEVVQTGSEFADALGYDITGVLVGSEGTLGVVTAATVQLMPQAETVRTLLVVFATVEDASAAVSAIIAAGIVPTAMEMMDGRVCRAVEAAVHAGYPADAGGVLLIEVESVAEGIDDTMALIVDICRANRAGEVRHASTAAERAALWLGRKSALGAMGRIAPSYFLEDGVVPRHKLPEVMTYIEDVAERWRLPIGNFFHAGDGNIHPTILFDRRDEDALARARGAAHAILEKCIAVGGTVSGEHGIGTEKQDYMALLYTADDLDAMWDVKRSFDPEGRLNPGKIFPRTYRPAQPEPNVTRDMSAGLPAPAHAGTVFSPRRSTDARLVAALERLVGSAAVTVTDGKEFGGEGEAPYVVVRPASVAEVAEVLCLAGSERLGVTPIGGGTRPCLGGTPARCDIVLGMDRLNGIIEHYPSDLTLAVQAGATLASVNDRLAAARQMLPLDAPLPHRSTLGGIIAAGAPAAGLRRLAYGTARDMLIGVQVLRPDGRSFHRGRMVVKNVAGYDLVRLQYGALGSLGVITAANFKLQPLPESSGAAIGNFAAPAAAEPVVRQLMAARLQPAAVLLFSTAESALPKRWLLCVRFDGSQRAVLRQTGEVVEWLRAAGGSQADALDAKGVDKLWPALVDFSQMAEVGDSEVLLRVNVRSSDGLATLSAYAAQCEALGLSVAALADAGCGVIWLRIQAPDDRLVGRLGGTLPGLLQEWRAQRTQIVVAAAPPGLKAGLDLWGPPPPALTVMQRLKMRFDPDHVLNPGRDLVSASLMAGGRGEMGRALPAESGASHVG